MKKESKVKSGIAPCSDKMTPVKGGRNPEYKMASAQKLAIPKTTVRRSTGRGK